MVDPYIADTLVLALKDADPEAQMVRRFLGPPYAVGATTQTSHHGQTGVRRISR
jgi:hypothetical protein